MTPRLSPLWWKLGVFFSAVFFAAPAVTASRTANFTISAQFIPAPPTSPPAGMPGYCSISPNSQSAGAVRTVVCTTGQTVSLNAPEGIAPWAPMHGGAYRFLHLGTVGIAGSSDQSPRMLGQFDVYTAPGTITTWQIVNLSPDVSYLEMNVNW